MNRTYNKSDKKLRNQTLNTQDLSEQSEVAQSNLASYRERLDIIGESRQTLVAPKDGHQSTTGINYILRGIQKEVSFRHTKQAREKKSSLGIDLSYVLDKTNHLRKIRFPEQNTNEIHSVQSGLNKPRNSSSKIMMPSKISNQSTSQILYNHQNLMKKEKSTIWKGLNIQEQDSTITRFNIQTVIVRGNSIIDNKKFMKAIIPMGSVVKAKIVRDKDGFNAIYPAYHMYSEQGKYLGSAKKRMGNLTSNYLISVDKTDLQTTGKNYIGKIRSNFAGTVFNVFDGGINPTSTKAINGQNQPRELIATISYNQETHFSKCPRELSVYFLKQGINYLDLAGTSKNREQIDLCSLYNIQKNRDKIDKLVNKKPSWNNNSRRFQLDFRGKMEIESIKNMILARADNLQQEILLFTKLTHTDFHLQFCYPLSPRIVMGVLVSSFDFKWKVQ